MSEAPILDPTALDGLRKFGQADFVRKMVEIFLLSTKDTREELRALLAEKDWKGLAFAAHSIKSGAGNLGLLLLTERCTELEKAAKDGSEAGLESLVSALEAAYRGSCEALREYLGRG
jgi:HPt (histidine-containing phosphotransfer) domain-containing protein